MDDHIHFPLFLTTLSSMCFFLLITLPQSHSQEIHDTRFSVCSRPFNCGSVSNLNYPFWAENRPRYCGGSDQFKLNCNRPYKYTSIEIGSQNFEVQYIDTNAYTMILARQDSVIDVCSEHLTNISLSPPFWYSQTVSNITIFYDCPSNLSIGENNFTCPNDGSLNAFYANVGEAMFKQFSGLNDCKRRTAIQAPAFQDFKQEAGGKIDALKNALNGDFEVMYSAGGDECTTCLGSNGICGTDDTAKHQFSCFCPDGTNAKECSVLSPHHRSNLYFVKRRVVIGIVSAAIGGLLICIIICYFRRKSSPQQLKFWLTRKSNLDIEAFLKEHGALALKRYTFLDVKKMTDSFKVKLGQGGFGAVYKGKLLNDCPVAVKILNESKGTGEEFMNEVASISRTSHVNVVTLLGFCFEGHKKVLIYEFMANGSLEKLIYKKGHETTPALSWDNLFQIAIGIARGLEYLHKGCNTRILHFDIKPHNILLDENFSPKISDFGLAKLCPRKESIISMSDARGTMGYVAPEMWNRHFGGVSHKSDVYSYGMMLLEMVGGRKNINADASHTSEIYFPHWVYKRLELGTNLGLEGVVATEEHEIAKKMTLVGLWCVQIIPNCRPAMSRVIDMLEGSLSSLEMPPKPVLSSPTRSVAESSITLN